MSRNRPSSTFKNFNLRPIKQKTKKITKNMKNVPFWDQKILKMTVKTTSRKNYDVPNNSRYRKKVAIKSAIRSLKYSSPHKSEHQRLLRCFWFFKIQRIWIEVVELNTCLVFGGDVPSRYCWCNFGAAPKRCNYSTKTFI